MALFGTKSSCNTCKAEEQGNLIKLRSTPEFAELQMHKQPKLNDFICRLLTSKGENCIAFEVCVGKETVKVDSPPYFAILLCGYERAMLDVLNQDSKTYQAAFQEAFSDIRDQPQAVMDWLEAIVYPPEDESLTPLPRSSKLPEYAKPPKKVLRILGA